MLRPVRRHRNCSHVQETANQLRKYTGSFLPPTLADAWLVAAIAVCNAGYKPLQRLSPSRDRRFERVPPSRRGIQPTPPVSASPSWGNRLSVQAPKDSRSERLRDYLEVFVGFGR
jgi:hypothetical protein